MRNVFMFFHFLELWCAEFYQKGYTQLFQQTGHSVEKGSKTYMELFLHNLSLRLQLIYKPILILAIILKKKKYVFLQTGILSFANYGENLFYWKNLTQAAGCSTETEEVCCRKCRLRPVCFIQEPLGWNFFFGDPEEQRICYFKNVLLRYNKPSTFILLALLTDKMKLSVCAWTYLGYEWERLDTNQLSQETEADKLHGSFLIVRIELIIGSQC